jgi:hypothetical protein
MPTVLMVSGFDEGLANLTLNIFIGKEEEDIYIYIYIHTCSTSK